jgi:ketosteroid isomerase-like protein
MVVGDISMIKRLTYTNAARTSFTDQKVITMKRIMFCLVFICLGQFAMAQTTEEAINKDVWYNFMQAYQDKDAVLFNGIHTSDVIRVSQDSKTMLIGQEYKDRNLENFNRWNSASFSQKIEFSFINRDQKGIWAYETGIYKLTRTQAGQSQSFYGKFNVTLKQVDGLWKIFVDADTSENETISEEDFQKGDILKY